jgi:hypothetical protein
VLHALPTDVSAGALRLRLELRESSARALEPRRDASERLYHIVLACAFREEGEQQRVDGSVRCK